MSRILRRPMFRGGPVDSRGTGITSGLADGGRVGFQNGGKSGLDFLKQAFLGPRFTDPNFQPPKLFPKDMLYIIVSLSIKSPNLSAGDN